MTLLAATIGALLVNNVVMTQFLGMCPFLGVGKRMDTALGMGGAVIFVITLATILCYLAQVLLLEPLGIEFMQIVVFMLLIAALVQSVELALRKISPPLYRALGIYLPLITTNCVVLAVPLLIMRQRAAGGMDLGIGVAYGVCTAAGFALALVLFAGIRERLEQARVPESFKGMPIALITAGLLALAFMGFAGMVK
jgi:electron transport complex protein RnfA